MADLTYASVADTQLIHHSVSSRIQGINLCRKENKRAYILIKLQDANKGCVESVKLGLFEHLNKHPLTQLREDVSFSAMVATYNLECAFPYYMYHKASDTYLTGCSTLGPAPILTLDFKPPVYSDTTPITST